MDTMHSVHLYAPHQPLAPYVVVRLDPHLNVMEAYAFATREEADKCYDRMAEWLRERGD